MEPTPPPPANSRPRAAKKCQLWALLRVRADEPFRSRRGRPKGRRGSRVPLAPPHEEHPDEAFLAGWADLDGELRAPRGARRGPGRGERVRERGVPGARPPTGDRGSEAPCGRAA